MSEISPQDLKARLDRNEPPLLLDVRQDWETRMCRLPNAVHIPIEEIELRVGELDAGDDIVVYCHQGVRSAAVVSWMFSRTTCATVLPSISQGQRRKRNWIASSESALTLTWS